MKKTIGIIGAGNMGGAMYKIWRQNLQVYICDRNYSKIKALGARRDALNLPDLLSRADIIILAVKPQSFKELASEIKAGIKNKLVISVMAGVSVRTISNVLDPRSPMLLGDKLRGDDKTKKIIRVMPNMPAKIGQGVSGWFAGKGVTKAEKTEAARLFSALGLAVEIKQEALLDAVTAVSGSGPAYFFYLCELLESAAVELGLDKKTAALLARQTFIGSAKLLQDSAQGAARLRLDVTSPNGTTAAAMSILEKNNFDKIFRSAVKSAFKRAKELSTS